MLPKVCRILFAASPILIDAFNTRRRNTMTVPFRWFEKTDRNKFDEYICNVKFQVQKIIAETFQDDKRIPANEKIQTAEQKINEELNRKATGSELYAIINGGEPLDIKAGQRLTIHLDELLPKFALPNPPGIRGDIPLTTLGITAAAGAFFGFILGGGIVGYLGNTPAETGHLFGAVAGAFATTAAGLCIANNPKLRKIAMTTVATAGIVDTVWQIVKSVLLPQFIPKWFAGSGKSGYWKRLLFYAGMLTVLFLLKRSRDYDAARFQSDTDTAVEQWMNSVLPLIAVLIFKQNADENDGIKTQNDKLVLACAPIIQRSRLQDSDDVDEVIQEFEKYGFQFAPVSAGQEYPEWIWAKELEETYETFGIIEYGQRVEGRKP
jgi:hypothetical protein